MSCLSYAIDGAALPRLLFYAGGYTSVQYPLSLLYPSCSSCRPANAWQAGTTAQAAAAAAAVSVLFSGIRLGRRTHILPSNLAFGARHILLHGRRGVRVAAARALAARAHRRRARHVVRRDRGRVHLGLIPDHVRLLRGRVERVRARVGGEMRGGRIGRLRRALGLVSVRDATYRRRHAAARTRARPALLAMPRTGLTASAPLVAAAALDDAATDLVAQGRGIRRGA